MTASNETKSENGTGDAHRDPARLEIPVVKWPQLSAGEKEKFFAQVDREIDEVGIVSVASALSHEQCDHFARLLQHELDHATHIERLMWERRAQRDGWKVYNLPTRHEDFLELVALAFTVEYMQSRLGKTTELHSSEGAITPPGGGNPPPGTSDPHSGWHVDVVERIPNHFPGMISIYYLCDTSTENGATRYIPGTHKNFISLEEALKSKEKYCPVKKGDMVIFNPNLWHAGSPNRTDKIRPVIINYYQRGYMKQGFDYPGTMSVAERKKLTPLLRQLLGFNRRVPRDVSEIYLFRKEMADFDPIGKLD